MHPVTRLPEANLALDNNAYLQNLHQETKEHRDNKFFDTATFMAFRHLMVQSLGVLYLCPFPKQTASMKAQVNTVVRSLP